MDLPSPLEAKSQEPRFTVLGSSRDSWTPLEGESKHQKEALGNVGERVGKDTSKLTLVFGDFGPLSPWTLTGWIPSLCPLFPKFESQGLVCCFDP